MLHQSVIPIGKYITVAEAVFDHLREQYGADEHVASKIRAALAELSQAFPEPSEVQGKKIIDIGSGCSIGRNVDATGWETPNCNLFHPWFSRTAAFLGADVTAVDIGEFAKEPFTAITMDISEPGAMHRFKSNEYDAVHISQLSDSPLLLSKLGDAGHRSFVQEMSLEVRRILKPDAKFLVICDFFFRQVFAEGT